MNSDFVITVHRDHRIIEVKYPVLPTVESFRVYERNIREAIDKMGPPWDCLVDQTALKAFAPELTTPIAELNRWALGKGMRRTARVLALSAIGELQSTRLLKEGGVSNIAQVFRSREEAWAALTRGAGSAPRATVAPQKQG
jgi:hypothetical protein